MSAVLSTLSLGLEALRRWERPAYLDSPAINPAMDSRSR